MDRMKWWRDARFGMFIHWGLYAEPAGFWKGKKIKGTGEWILKNAKIPVVEYRKLADKFNPVDFNADEWVSLCKDAGMKYLTITAKHHDGFAMYHSKCSDYNIVDATPYKKDLMKELALACDKQGIKFCLYYSHYLDWDHPHAYGNDWDYNPDKKDFSIYFEEKCLPQIEELMENYGDIGQVWFDGGTHIEKIYAQKLHDLIRKKQPETIISGRLGYGLGDFRSMGDNRVPFTNYYNDWDTPSTLNDTWSYTTWDDKWKNPQRLISLLSEINSKGGNYLLNIGPDEKGKIPDKAVDILKTVGNWMDINGESIYNTQAAPIFPYNHDWGFITQKPGKLFLHILKWPEQNIIFLSSLSNVIKKAYPLSDLKQQLNVRRATFPAEPEWRITISLPEKPLDEYNTVICLELENDNPIIINPLI